MCLDPIANKWCEMGSRKIVTAFRRGTHLSEELRSMNDKVIPNIGVTNNNGYTGCNKCMLCSYSKFDSWVIDFTTGYKYPINGNFDCNSKNAIYYIWVDYNEKSFPYIGRSTNPKSRFSSHKNQSGNSNSDTDSRCGLSDFLYKNCGGWLDNSQIHFMIIDGIYDKDIPTELTKKTKCYGYSTNLRKWRKFGEPDCIHINLMV